MDHSQIALAKLNSARNAFDVAGAGYALLTSVETRDAIRAYEVELSEKGFRIGANGEPTDGSRGIRRIVRWRGAVGEEGAKRMLELVFQKMISDGVDAIKAYAQAINEWHVLKKQDWFAMAMHLRNAYAHNGKWHFESHAIVPVTYRNRTVSRDMHGTSAVGFFSYLDGQQLLAQMTLYASGIVDYAQQHIPTNENPPASAHQGGPAELAPPATKGDCSGSLP